MPVNMENSAVATGPENVSFHFNIKEGQSQRMFKLPQNCVLISHDSKIMPKSFKLAESFQMYKLDLEKAEEPEMKLPTSVGS